MNFSNPLIPAILLRRYKRFLADVQLENGDILTVHTPNTGRMLGLTEPGTRVWLRDSENPKRKYRYSWEIASTAAGEAVGVNTHLANRLVVEGIESGLIPELAGYSRLKTEVPYGEEGSRIDIYLDGRSDGDCFVEVKNVTAVIEPGIAVFPDAVSQRGSKHLRELISVRQQGSRAVIFFCVQRSDAGEVRPADNIDPHYGQTLREALEAGVEAMAYRARVSPEGIILEKPLPVCCP